MASDNVDVLIIGAGPAGLMLLTWMARLGIKARIIDKRLSAINSGQADGLQSRTFEIFDSLGFGQDIWREANHMLEIRFWNPDKDNNLYRSDHIVDTLPGLSRFQQATLHQARIENYLLGYVKKYSDVEVERGIMPESLTIDTEKVKDDDAYPVTVTLRHLPQNTSTESSTTNGSSIPNGLFRSNLTADNTNAVLLGAQESAESHTETIRAKYVVGCDGAHSWTRQQIGSVMEGEHSDYIWGVLDIIPITDFPDIRYRCAIHSSSGSMMIIPRENKYVRLYIQVTEMDENGQPIDRFKVSPETLIAAARRILSPYTLSFKHCHWWTAYRIGQRIGSKFTAHDRVLLAGDAVHTHSPKAGQGMNISMHDTFNMGWKLAHVVRGWANRSLLKTYSTERRQIAQELIDFDQKFSRLFSGKPAIDILDKEGVDMHTFKTVFEKGNLFASGCSVEYATNLIVAKKGGPDDVTIDNKDSAHHNVLANPSLASKVIIGMRMPSYKVLNQADGRPWHLQELLPSNGTWRILVFAGNIKDPIQYSRFEKLGNYLSSSNSILRQYQLARGDGVSGSDPEGLIDVLTIHSAARLEVELSSIPQGFRPFSEEYGWDYNKVFVDDASYHEGHGHAYDNYGIDKLRGCLMIVRPDQYVSWIGALEDVAGVERFFSSFLNPQVIA